MVLSSSNPSLDWIQQQTVGVRMRKSLPQRRDPAKSRLLLPELSNSCSKSGQAVAGPLAGLGENVYWRVNPATSRHLVLTPRTRPLDQKTPVD